MKRIFTLILSIICTFILIGCNNNDIVVENTQINEIESKEVEELVEDTWGITLSTKDITSMGLTLVCTQSGGEPTGELNTGSFYTIEKFEDGKWVKVEYAPQEYDIGWTSEAWIIPMNDTVEWSVNWEWLYGQLPEGKYRIGKEFMDFRETGDYDTQFCYAEFEVEI